MMKDEVAPALRVLGLRGSGRAFSIPSERYWALIGFQGSRHSDRDAVSFTINLKVVSHDAWAEIRVEQPWRSERPSANESLSLEPGAWDQRLGFLLPARRDQWWTLRAGAPTRPLATEIVAAIRDYALPAMRARMI